MGVVVNNGIVMIEHINNLRRRGMARTEALVEGSRERLRPILMTMGTAILAMVPICADRHADAAATARRTTRWRARSPAAWRSRPWSACCSCRRSTRCSTTCARGRRIIRRARGCRQGEAATAAEAPAATRIEPTVGRLQECVGTGRCAGRARTAADHGRLYRGIRVHPRSPAMRRYRPLPGTRSNGSRRNGRLYRRVRVHPRSPADAVGTGRWRGTLAAHSRPTHRRP